jgi:hypothetical protein
MNTAATHSTTPTRVEQGTPHPTRGGCPADHGTRNPPDTAPLFSGCEQVWRMGGM